MREVLQLDLQGTPVGFIDLTEAATAYAKDQVAWTIGDKPLYVMRGGVNAFTGRQSTLEIHPIIALGGTSRVNLHDVTPALTNDKLWRRDRLCVYCGKELSRWEMTREHIVPTSRGGLNKWINVACACRGCNGRKGARTPEEAGMELIYLPYTPSLYEDMLLQGRRIRADVREWLASKLPKNSRLA